jgi:hypothetical protein
MEAGILFTNAKSAEVNLGEIGLNTIKGSQGPWRGHLFMFINFNFIQLSVC